MKALRIPSCMAPIMDPLHAAIAVHLAESAGFPVGFLRDMEWREREQAYARGAIDLVWLCGLPMSSD